MGRGGKHDDELLVNEREDLSHEPIGPEARSSHSRPGYLTEAVPKGGRGSTKNGGKKGGNTSGGKVGRKMLLGEVGNRLCP